jgi:hypothetical protein
MRRGNIKDLDITRARFVNLGLAGWALVSAFLWRHSEPQFLVTIIVGVIVAISAPFEVGSPLIRKINVAAGAVLALAALVLPRRSTLGLWHNLFLGLVIAGVAFFGPPHGVMSPRPPAPDDAYEATGGV